ncbi:hypothetical protein PMAYCL1PPCAC_01876, partial [Pristionchus mayeri]
FRSGITYSQIVRGPMSMSSKGCAHKCGYNKIFSPRCRPVEEEKSSQSNPGVRVHFKFSDAEVMANHVLGLGEIMRRGNEQETTAAINKWTKQMIFSHLPKMMKGAHMQGCTHGGSATTTCTKKAGEPWKMTTRMREDKATSTRVDPRAYLWEQRPSTSDGRGMDRPMEVEMFKVEYEATKMKMNGGGERRKDIFAPILNHNLVLKDVGMQTDEEEVPSVLELTSEEEEEEVV